MEDKNQGLEQAFKTLDSIYDSEYGNKDQGLERAFKTLDSIYDAEYSDKPKDTSLVKDKAATETPNTPSYINSTGVMDYERNWPSREDVQEVLNEQTWLQPTPEEWTTPMSQEQVEQYNQSKRNFNEELQATKKEVDSQLQGARKGLDDLRKKDPLGFSLPTHSFTSGISFGSRDTKTNAKTWDAAEATLSKVQRRINNYESDSSREYGVVPMVEGLVSTLVGEWLPEVVTQGSVEFGRQEEKMKLAKQLSGTQDKISTNNTQQNIGSGILDIDTIKSITDSLDGLNDAQKSLYKAMLLEYSVDLLLSDKESRGRKIGATTAHFIGFMTELMVGTGLIKASESKAISEFVKRGSSKALSQAQQTTLRKFINSTTKVAKNIFKEATRTTGVLAPSVSRDMARATAPTVDSEGNIQYQDAKDRTKSMSSSLAMSYISNLGLAIGGKVQKVAMTEFGKVNSAIFAKLTQGKDIVPTSADAVYKFGKFINNNVIAHTSLATMDITSKAMGELLGLTPGAITSYDTDEAINVLIASVISGKVIHSVSKPKTPIYYKEQKARMQQATEALDNTLKIFFPSMSEAQRGEFLRNYTEGTLEGGATKVFKSILSIGKDAVQQLQIKYKENIANLTKRRNEVLNSEYYSRNHQERLKVLESINKEAQIINAEYQKAVYNIQNQLAFIADAKLEDYAVKYGIYGKTVVQEGVVNNEPSNEKSPQGAKATAETSVLYLTPENAKTFAPSIERTRGKVDDVTVESFSQDIDNKINQVQEPQDAATISAILTESMSYGALWVENAITEIGRENIGAQYDNSLNRLIAQLTSHYKGEKSPEEVVRVLASMNGKDYIEYSTRILSEIAPEGYQNTLSALSDFATISRAIVMADAYLASKPNEQGVTPSEEVENAEVNQFATYANEDGVVMPIKTSGGVGYVKKGKVVLDEKGNIDRDNSSKEIYYMNEKGEVDVADINAISIDNINPLFNKTPEEIVKEMTAVAEPQAIPMGESVTYIGSNGQDVTSKVVGNDEIGNIILENGDAITPDQVEIHTPTAKYKEGDEVVLDSDEVAILSMAPDGTYIANTQGGQRPVTEAEILGTVEEVDSMKAAQLPTVEAPTLETKNVVPETEGKVEEIDYEKLATTDPLRFIQEYDKVFGEGEGVKALQDVVTTLESTIQANQEKLMSPKTGLNDKVRLKKEIDEIQKSLDIVKGGIPQAKAETPMEVISSAPETISEAETQEEIPEGPSYAPIKEKWDNAKKIEGVKDELVLPNGDKLPGRYVMTEVGSYAPSHNPHKNFVMTEGFPTTQEGTTVNDRDYASDKNAQALVEKRSASYDQRAITNPVVVSQDGIVLSGNDRTMAGELAAVNNTDSKYVEYLQNYGGKYGFTPEQVGEFEHPRVVFVPDEALPYTTEVFGRFNAKETKSQSKTESAIKIGKSIKDVTVNKITTTLAEHEKIQDFFASDKDVNAVISTLVEDGMLLENEVAEMYDGDKLSIVGRDYLETIFLGMVLPEESVRMSSEIPSIRQTILSAIPALADNSRIENGYALTKELGEAISMLYRARKAGVKQGESLDDYTRQSDLFLGTPPLHTLVAKEMALKMNSKSKTSFRDFMLAYNRSATPASKGQVDIFYGRPLMREEIMQDLVNASARFQLTTPTPSRGIYGAELTGHKESVFESNAMIALNTIKQNKATGAQWLAMLQKAGGIKAGEDKWIGLSDFLTENKEKSLTREEIASFITENGIRLEEVVYADYSEGYNERIDEALEPYQEEFEELMAEGEEVTGSIFTRDHADYAFQKMVEKYGDDFKYGFEWGGEGYPRLSVQMDIDDEPSESALIILNDGMMPPGVKPIDSTRLRYTTEGLSNKKELAFVVPTIKSWDRNDKVHFGDAGEGRNIGWVRFGDGTYVESERMDFSFENFDKPYQNTRGENVYANPKRKKDYVVERTDPKTGKMWYGIFIKEHYSGKMVESLDKAKEEMNQHYATNNDTALRSRSVLMIDEIQSNRHQEGRQKGYSNITEKEQTRLNELRKELQTLGKELGDISEEIVIALMPKDAYYHLRHLSLNDNIRRVMLKDESTETSYRPLITIYGRQFYTDKEEVETLIRLAEQLRPLVLEEDRRDIDMFLEEMSQRDMQKLDTLYEREQELENKKDTIIKGEEWSTLTNKATKGIPAAPFEKNWAELIMKRMLRYAAENGYSRIAWTTGAQQADRYNMSTYMDTVKLTKREDGTYLLNGENNGVDVYGGIHTAEELSNLIGKEASLRWTKIADAAYEKVQPLREAADNLRSQADKEGYIRVTDHPEYGDKWEKLQDDIADINRECTHSGEDLAIGGEGMKAFYDVMLPSFVGKYGKKWGVNVEDISVSVGGGITVHSVKITDKMREDLQNPQPLFQVAPTQFNLIAPRVSRERIEPLVNRLKESGLAKDVIFVESEKDVQKYINIDESIKATVRGRMAAVTDDSGNIVIVEDNLRLDTPFHEYCHKLWSYAKETKRTNAIQAFKKIAENTPEHIKRFIDRNYGGLTYEAYCNEAFAWHTASKSSERMKEFLAARELDKRTSSEQLQDYEWYQNITSEIETIFKSLAKDYVEDNHDVYGVAPTTLAKIEDDELSVFDAYEEMSVEQLISAVYDVLMSGKRKQLQNDTPVEVMSQRSNESLITVHNITQEKLENALRLGGLANPSMATYDTSLSSHEGFGEISFIIPSEKLEGVTTFSRDAWTPKFPRVEYSFSDKAQAKYKEILMSVKDEELRRVMGWYLSAYLNESGPTSSPLAPLYLQEKGIPFSPARRQGRYRDQIHHLAERIFGGEVSKEAYDTLSKDQKAEFFLLINGKLKESEIDSPSYVDVLKDRIESNKERLSHIKDNPDATKAFVALIERRINENEALLELAYEADMTNVAIDMYQDKHTNRDLDAYKTFDNAEMVITEQGLLDEFNDWQDSMIDKIAPDKVFFSHYTSSGYRKYKPYTLDEVSKWMNKQGLNASDFGNQTGMEYFLSHMVKKMKSRAAIRKNRSMLVSNEDMIKWSENANEVYLDAFWGIMNDGDLAKRYSNDYIIADQVAFKIMQDAIIKKRPISTIEKEYKITLSDATRQAISDFATEAKNAVGNYFETKFQRPVYFNEFAAVVIPKDAKASLKERLEEEGVAVYEYDPNLPGNRSEVIDEATRNRNDVLFQFLGEIGAGNLDSYDESTLRLDNLNIAREMERQGKDAASIKHATGWERGKDEKWRYEIVDDFNGIESLWDRYRRLEKEYDEVSRRYERMSYQPLTTPKGAGEEVKKLFAAKRKKFKEVIKELNEKRDAMYDADPQKLINLDEYLGKDNLLFTAYPQLRKIKISSGFRRYYIDKGYGGYFDGSQIWISPYTEDYKSALIHEIQHAIQYIEGFAKGGSVETAGTIADRLLRDAAAVYKKMYASSSWQEREKLVSQTINEGVSDEVWSRIQELDKDKGVQEILELQHTFGRKYGNTAPVIDILSKPTQLDDEAWSNLFPRFYDPYEAYRSLAGETEARNVSKRMNMTEEERRKSLAEETEDVSREDQEVIFGRLGGIGMASASSDVRDVIDEAKAKGNYLKAPNGKESNLASLPNTWAQTRTIPFKEWFGNWDLKSNIKKLLEREDIVLTGNEIAKGENIKEYRENAKRLGLSLRGVYVNFDTGIKINVTKGSIKEIISHDVSEVQLQSVAAIPQIIENSIYVASIKNNDIKKHPDISVYDYYLCGIKIADIDYTVKAVIAVSNSGDRYYDHKLTEIEKGKLIELTYAITNHENSINSPLSDLKDKRLSLILQNNTSKIVDENGEPLIVYHGSGEWFEEFDPNAPKHSGAYDNTFYFTDNKEIANSFVPGRWFGVSHGEKSGMAKEVILDPDSPKHPKYAWGTHREGGIYSVFLNMRKPFVVDFKGKPWYDVGNGDSLDDIANKVRLEGKYDGVIAKNIKDVGHNDYQLEKLPNVTVYVTFKPEQAKSATQNEGTFDNENKKLRFRRAIGGNSGYVGYSMSKRAAEAREEGRFPKSDFKKEYGISDSTLNALVELGIINNSEWHHTSMYGNRTTFYGWDEPWYSEYYLNNKKEIDSFVKKMPFAPQINAYPSTQEGMDAFTQDHENYKKSLQSWEDAIKEKFESLEGEYNKRQELLKQEEEKRHNLFLEYAAWRTSQIDVPSEYRAANGVLVKTNGSKNFGDWEAYYGEKPAFKKYAYNAKHELWSKIENQKESLPTFEEWKENNMRSRTSEQLFKEPTEAQKKAGNYKMEHLRRGGYNISIENPKGSVRRGTDENGVKWENEMPYDYGYIRGTKGKDGDHIDIFLGPIEDPLEVYVVDQINPKTGKFDESKVMFGFASIDEARRAYEAAYDKDWKGLDKITATTKETFDAWIDSHNKQSKPFSEYVLIEKTKRQEEAGPLRDYEEKAKEVCKVINSDIVIIRDINEIKDSNPINEAKKRNSKGWYDPTEGKTYIVLPNAESVEDVKETVMHENLGHRSLREMLGDKADAFFRSVYRGMSIDAKAKYMGQENAAEEYVADMAQTYTKPSQWARIKAMFRALLRKLGINIKMTDADIRYYLYKACKHGKKRTLIEETEVKATEYELNKARQNPRYRVIGEKGVSTIASTKELHLTDNLAKAKELYSLGANPEKIQRMTGWYMAKDGKWRIERSDRDLVINLESITREAVRARRDVLNKIGEYEKALDEGMDPISTEMDNMAMEVENLKAMYEEQYGIISDFENATKGEVVSAMLHMGISMREILKGSGILEEYPALGEYTLMVNDYMPQGTVGSYDPLYKTITLSSRLFNKYSKEEIERASSELMHEIQHFIQDEEGFMSGGSTRGVAKVKESLKKQIDIALGGELKRKGSLYALLGDSNISEEVYDTLERIAKENSFADSEELIQFLTEEDYDSYTSLLGEVEARRVERRRWMTEEEIKQIDEVYEKEMLLSYALNIPDKAMNEDSRSYRRFKLIEEVDRLMNGLGKVTEKHKRHIVVQYIKNYLTKNDMYNFSKGDLARVLGWVEKAPTRRDFHHALSVLYFEVARLGYQQSIRKIRALKAKKLDGDKNGVSQARSVDASTREFFRLFTEKTGPAMRRLGNPVDVLERELYNDSNGEPTGIEADLSRLADLLAKDPTSNEYRISYQDALYKKAALNLAIRYEEALDTRDVIMRQLSAIQHEWETLRGIYNRMKASGATPYDVELYKAKMSRVADERIALSEEMAALSDEMEEIAQTLNRALQEGIMNLENEVIAREDERILNIQRALQSLGTQLYMGEYKSLKDTVKEGAIKAWHTAYMPIFNMTNTLRFISGRKYPEGKSPMWRFYTEQGMKASEAYYNHTTELARRIENKSIELFNLRFRDVTSRAKAKIGIEVSDRELAYVDEATATGQSLHTQSVGGKGHPIELTMDAALYILGLTRNPEIKERYIARGISDDKLMEIRNAVLQQPNGDKYLQLLDWIQFELIPSTRGRYNATHRLLNGRNMAHVVNYLPLKVRKADQTPKQDALAGNQNMPRSVEETGHIKNRQSTKAIPSLTQGILEYLPSYIQKMEEWDAYALFGRSVNDILKSKEFRNRMEANMPGMYNILADAFQVATGAYTSAEEFNNRIYKFLEKARSRVVGANIAYNMIPAIKQFLSYPSVFDSYNTLSFYKMMVKYSNPVDNIKWVMDGNLPLLKKRWEQGIAGFQELQWQGGSFITGPIIKFLRDLWVKKKGDVADWVLSAAEFMREKAGMLPNRAIDVFTCSMVARPVYEETYRRMKKRGATDEEAKKEAEYMATLTYNASQQSNERWITSPMQSEKGWAKILTTYQNTNIQQQALLQLAYMELAKNKKVEVKQLEEKYIIANKRKGYSDEEAKKEAHKEATAEVKEIKRKASMNVFLYAYFMKFLWGLGGVMFSSILTGDDREKKFKSALTPGQYVLQGIGQGSAFWIPLELSVGTLQSSSQVEIRPDMLADFINDNIKMFSDEEKDWSDKAFAALNLLHTYDTGLDLRKVRNMFFSLQNLPKALEHEKGGRDIMLQILNLSPSQRKRILMQKLDGETHEEYQERVSDMADILYQIEVKEDEIKQKYIEKRLEEVADQKGELDDYVAVKTYVDETLKERGISKSGFFGTQDKKEEANKRRDNIELVKLLKRNQATMKKITFKVEDLSDKDYRELYEDFYQNLRQISNILESMPK